ncbi:Rhodanese-like domain-containing protein 14, chloroplastic [Dendrobium catenatum]|uniref:Rhodanese-like domain-containing protein 14, chloroplastic n=1 Tax=Dendrobium catenatum TaxID=906689 RepID=A0A2I0W1Z1_9ASPA|nr:Rhodanese-like domain-containing protein 14, chloroplastic [Dendrobium catenatum]
MELMKMCSGKTVSALVYEHMWFNRCNLEDVDYFSWVQNLKMNKKVEIFWWRLGKSAIPTNMFLMNRKISDNALCARGCQVNETYEHIMVHCKYLIEIIMKLREWGIFIPVFRSLDCCLRELKKISTQNSGIVRVYCSIVYYSWKNRNDIKHGKSALPCSTVAANALFLAVSKSSPYLSSWGTNLLLIKEWTPWDIARRAAFLFFGIISGTEENPEFLQIVESKLDKDAKIIVACSSGGTMRPSQNLPQGQQSRSLIAAYLLVLNGYNNVYHLDGGLYNWFKEGLPSISEE